MRRIEMTFIKTTKVLLFFLFLSFSSFSQNWKGNWMTAYEAQSATNTWTGFRKVISINKTPGRAIARIAVDSKYWLWINGKMVVFEGGLKRGPSPKDTYFDEVDIAPYLKSGSNTIAILAWYFGKDGFSHNSSGKAGLFFDCQANGLEIISDRSWKAAILPSYKTCDDPLVNFRLAESSILYDARKEIGNWQQSDFDDATMQHVNIIGKAGSAPWNILVKRPIPLWKDFGLKTYNKQVIKGDTIICDLPYNAQITPYLKVEGDEGKKVTICTDNYLIYHGGAVNVRAEYISKKGLQEYESLGWMNGHKVYYIIPKGVKVLALLYRETGYDTEFSGSFTSSDSFLNKLWDKSARTLYITMRDNYMDCPDRERAQWTGDAVNESGQAFYILSRSSDQLSSKWLHEIINWQRKDSSLFSPSPAGNYDYELPAQILATIGHYGVWNYYLNSGDKQTIRDLYPGIKRYLALWNQDERGIVPLRKGGWDWGDWGENVDMLAIYNLWYYLALKSQVHIAHELGYTEDAKHYESMLSKFEIGFNNRFWDDQAKAYRSPGYKGKTDDRTQALAIVSGIAKQERYPSLLRIFKEEEHASPYMEKYVYEAMMVMGEEEEALSRHKKRFSKMVYDERFTTLFEGWGIGTEGFGGGTVNHAWSGGGATIASQYICGIAPLEPGYKKFQIQPQPGSIAEAKALVPSVSGNITSAFISTKNHFQLIVEVPKGTEAIVNMPEGNYTEMRINETRVWKAGKFSSTRIIKPNLENTSSKLSFIVSPGRYTIKALY
jgi:hypothetical protein